MDILGRGGSVCLVLLGSVAFSEVGIDRMNELWMGFIVFFFCSFGPGFVSCPFISAAVSEFLE